ncbi:MAG: hypothetical protein QOJ78_1005, partial [Pseudonocardiales bacterium]|nr:hypothetical protein [Pseudonocardiales bacterium]
HQELGAAAGDEYPGVDLDAKAAELGPAQEVLERLACNPAIHERAELVRRARRSDEQLRLVLGEYAAGRSQRRDNDGQAG